MGIFFNKFKTIHELKRINPDGTETKTGEDEDEDDNDAEDYTSDNPNGPEDDIDPAEIPNDGEVPPEDEAPPEDIEPSDGGGGSPPPEDDIPPEDTEEPPADEGEVPPEDGEVPPEGEEAPADTGEEPSDDDAMDYTQSTPDDGGEPAPEGNGSEEPPADEGEVPPEDGEVPPEGEEAPADSAADDVKAMEDELFSELSPEQMGIKHMELKTQYIELFSTIGDVIDRVNKIPKTDSNTKVLEFISIKLTELRDLVNVNLVKVYDTRTYMENNVVYQQCLVTLNTINTMLEEISPKSDS